MKKLLPIALVTIVSFTACNNDNKDQKNNVDSTASKNISTNTLIPIGDNSSNALDWPGTYAGVLPCADCEGIEKTITLNKDNTYTLTSKYLGKKADLLKSSGTFTWNKEGSSITLSGIKNEPAQFLVGENKLFQLDMSGNKITGNLAEKYELIKQ